MQKNELGELFASAVAAELKWQLKRISMSAATLSKMVGVAPQTVGLWLNGKSKIPFSFVYMASLVSGMAPSSLFALAEIRLQTENPMLISGDPEWRDPVALTPAELQHQGNRFLQCVAAELRTQLAEQDLSVRQVSIRLGKAPGIAGDWITGRKVIPIYFAYDICTVLGISITQLVTDAEARIDLYPEDPDEQATEEASAPKDGDTTQLTASEAGRRIQALLEINSLDPDHAFSRIVADHPGVITRQDWDNLIAGRSVPSVEALSAVSNALGAPNDYLLEDDADLTNRVEAEAELARVAAEAGVKNIAARGGQLSAESLHAIANLVTRYIDK